MKVKVVFDSSCGLSKQEAEKMGFGYVPIIVEFEGKEYESGVNIDDKFLFKNMNKTTKVKTAAVKLGQLEEIFDDASEKYDEILFISLSKHLSSINSLGITLAKKYDNVKVYDSEFITPWLTHILDDIKKLAETSDMNSIIKMLDKYKGKMYGWLIPSNMDALYAGGRISKAQYLVGSLAKITPIIAVDNGSINEHDVIKARGLEKAINKTIEAVEKRVAEYKDKEIIIFTSSFDNDENRDILKNKIKNSNLSSYELKDYKFSSEIIAHVGPGAIAIGIIIK